MLELDDDGEGKDHEANVEDDDDEAQPQALVASAWPANRKNLHHHNFYSPHTPLF